MGHQRIKNKKMARLELSLINKNINELQNTYLGKECPVTLPIGLTPIQEIQFIIEQEKLDATDKV